MRVFIDLMIRPSIPHSQLVVRLMDFGIRNKTCHRSDGCGPKKKPRQNRGGTSISVRGGKAYLLVAQCNTVFLRFAQGKSSLLAQSKEKAPPRTEPRQPGPSTKISNWPGSVRRYLSKPGRKRPLMEVQLANKL